jgi:4-hydroxy-3-methylbut-2-en-1-yl diphosphate synthase IspG/GcpE
MSTPYTMDVVYKKYTVYVTTCPLCGRAIYELDEFHPTYEVKAL